MLQLQLVKSLGFKGVNIGRYCMYLIGNLNAFFFFPWILLEKYQILLQMKIFCPSYI